jgi:parvulin-like peptidyl-prolyl isomerase
MSRTRPVLAVAVLVLSFVLVSCAEATSVATVNGEPIQLEQVTALRHSFNEGATVDSEAFRQDLTPLIFLEAELQAAEEDFGLTGLDSDERIDALLADPTPAEQQIFDQVSANPDRTDEVLRVVAVQLIVRQEVTEQLLAEDPGFLADLFANDPTSLATVCARHILTLTREEIDAARERVIAGEDFATVADEVSIDTGAAGGVLPCPAQASTYVEPFGSTSATAPIGEVTEPFQTEFGWHIVIVDERRAPASLEELAADPTAWLDPAVAGELWGAWLDGAVAGAVIVVDSEVGTWFAEGDGILPPS